MYTISKFRINKEKPKGKWRQYYRANFKKVDRKWQPLDQPDVYADPIAKPVRQSFRQSMRSVNRNR